MAIRNYNGWETSTTYTGDYQYNMLNPPNRKRHEHVNKYAPPKDSVWLEGNFIAKPTYTNATNCPFCHNFKFLGYQLWDNTTSNYWKQPRPLADIKRHHADVMQAIRAAKAITLIGQRLLEPIQEAA